MRRLLVVLLLAVPLAAADHVYSHRFVVEGRLLGADGFPIPGQEVQVVSSPAQLREPCPGRQQAVTDAWGDFGFCYHNHEMDAGTVTVVAGNATATAEVDLDLRRVVLYLRDPTTDGVEPPRWNDTFHVDGRLWSSGDTVLDGVRVNGIALDHVPVNLTVVNATRDEDAPTRPSRLRTDAYGDYRGILRLNPGERPEDAVIELEAAGQRRVVGLDLEFHRMTHDLRFPVEEDAGPAFFEGRPGTASGPVSPWLVLAVGAALAIAVAVAARKG